METAGTPSDLMALMPLGEDQPCCQHREPVGGSQAQGGGRQADSCAFGHLGGGLNPVWKEPVVSRRSVLLNNRSDNNNSHSSPAAHPERLFPLLGCL